MTENKKEQITQYIKNLEQKVKKYHVMLKKRDEEIAELRNKLTTLVQERKTYNTNKKKLKIQASGGESNQASEAASSKEDQTPKKPIEMPEGQLPPKPSMNFEAGKFLSAVLEGEEEADEVKYLLEKLENCEQEERRPTLKSLTRLHWKMTNKMAFRLLGEGLPWEKRLFMRYGMLDDKLMKDRMDVWEVLYRDKSQPEDSGIYFIDEWFEEIARGRLKFSTIDEMALDGAKPNLDARGEEALRYELTSVPQMQRMCVGPRANEVTILMQEYCSPGRDNPIVNRDWLKKAVKHVEKCDCQIFQKKYKGEEVYLPPLFIICPGYGQRAGCWEPWSPGKKGRSKPRICICAFPPRSSMKTLLMGMSDLRWEYAKEDAMHYWMSEGLTGKWLGLFSTKEQRKDLKGYFQENYFLWVAYESRRIPKMERKFREFFWYNIPFSDEVKQTLKGGGLFARLIELEEAKKKREEEERQEMERIKAEREARKATRKAKLEGRA